MFEWLLDRYAAERFVITRAWSAVPYMVRWTLLGSRYGKAGPNPDPVTSEVVALQKERQRAVFVHKFLRSDADEMHDHPWPFTSVILSGGYWEETPAPGWANGSGPVRRRWYGPGRVLRRPANWIHRVVIPEGREAWTLVFRGVKERSWGFWCPVVGFVPWRSHLANLEATGAGCPGAGGG